MSGSITELDDYQKKASETNLRQNEHSNEALAYLALGLTGEAGEVAEKVKKVIRGDRRLEDVGGDLVLELGDVMWYCAQLADYLDVDLSAVASANISKLQSRQARGAIRGDGDHR